MLIASLFFFGCIPPLPKEQPTEPAGMAPDETVPVPQAFFCPTDNCTSVFLDVLSAGKRSIHCALYAVNIPSVLALFGEKSAEADVKVAIDDENPLEGQELGGLKGAFDFRLDTPSQRSHNKFCVIDGYLVLTGSFNPTVSEEGNLNNVILFHSKSLAANFEDEFQEIWNGDFGKGEPVRFPKVMLNGKLYENYFCPEDDCAMKTIEQISKARRSIYFLIFTFTHEGIADALLRRDDVDIKGLLDNRQASQKTSQFQRLLGFGMDVKKDAFRKTMHHKVFIIDNETVITGSFNPTKSADSKNDENIAILHDRRIAKEFAEEFFRLFRKE
ncbi:hypothetical protein HYU13_00395 [Candidatus Woesearchaeota archaeon]|nr:hypothetical protein [Candidatus Woesearchaeota archaeon]